jgi:hypothetical protein
MGGEEMPPAGACLARGKIESLLYLGSSTRFNVTLEGGGELTVIEQNRAGGARGGAEMQGRPVLLWWRKDHMQSMAEAAPA